MKYLKEFDNIGKLAKHCKSDKYVTPNVYKYKKDDDIQNTNDVYINDDNTLICIYDKTLDPGNTQDLFNGGTSYQILESIVVDGKYNRHPMHTVSSNMLDGDYHVISFKFKDKTKIGGGQQKFISNNTLKTIIIPKSVTTIDQNAFQYCENLKEIIFSDSLTTIKSNAFYHCSSLETLDIPNSVITIEEEAFIGCTSLKKVKIPSSLTSATNIFSGVFNQSHPCEELYFDNKNLSIHSLTQYIKKLIIGPNTVVSQINSNTGESINKISSNIFFGGLYFDHVELPENIDYAPGFSGASGCTNQYIEEIKLGTNIKDIDSNYPFGGLSVKKIDLSDTQIDYIVPISGISSLEEYILPSGLKKLSSKNSSTPFSGVSSLKTIDIPDTVTEIQSGIFAGWYGLEEITIPDSVVKINYPDSENIDLYDRYTYFGRGMFNGCPNLTTINASQSFFDLIQYPGAYNGCYNLGYVENGVRYIDVNDTIGTDIIKLEDTSLKNIAIKDTVKTIYNFDNSFNSVESITLPNTITIITNDIFKGYESCFSKEQANFILSINENALNKTIIDIKYGNRSDFIDKNLTIYALENGTINIGRNIYSNYYVYYKKNGSTSETAIKGSISVSKNDTIEFYTNSDKEILSSMTLNFDAYICGNLSSIIGNLTSFCFGGFFKGSTSSYLNIDKLILPDISNCVVDQYSIAGPLKNLFENCIGITSIPKDLLPFTKLKPYCYANMFKGCTGLTSIPENLLPANHIQKSSYEGMFANCTNLSNVPENLLMNIKWLNTGSCQYMFYGCTSLVKAPTIPELSSNISNMLSYMFQGCSSLNYIKNLTWYNANCFNNWVDGVSPAGTFVKNPDATDWPTGVSGIPEGWTVEDYVETN